MTDLPYDSVEATAGDPKGQVLQSLHGRAPADLDRPAGEGREDDVIALRRENEQLRETIAGHAVLEQAKGALMLQHGIDADQANKMLIRAAQDCDTELHTLANTLVTVMCSEREHQQVKTTVVRWLEEALLRSPETGDGSRRECDRTRR